MVLCYLRREDLLKPDYPLGLRSRIRENAVIDALDCEYQSSQLLDQLRLHEALLPMLVASAREEKVNKMIELLTASKCYSDLDRVKARTVLSTVQRETAATIYEILKKYNYWDERPDFTPGQYREIIGRINELKQQNGPRTTD